MNKTAQKRKLLANNPRCSRCTCQLKLIEGNPHPQMPNTAAIVVRGPNGPTLICWQCHNIEMKQKMFAQLPFRQRLVRNFDKATGLITFVSRTRKRLNKWVYVNIKGGKLNGKP